MKYNKEEIELELQKGKNLKQLGTKYGVSKQRMYQVLSNLGIKTPEQNRKTKFTELDEKHKWAWKTINHKLQGKPKPEKLLFLEKLVLPDVCPVLGIPIDYSFGKGVRSDNSPSIDQIFPAKGYYPENCIVISWRANRIKNDGTPEEHRKIAEYYTT